MKKSKEQRIEELLSRGVEEVIVRDDLGKKLKSDEKIRVYFGIDPTGAKLHLGHAVVLRKLKEFCNLGHEVILLIGDFTAKIGDPSGRDTMRVPLTDKQVKENMKDYKKQASKILDFSRVKIKYNSKWLAKLKPKDILKLFSLVTLKQLEQREMFQKRIKEDKPIGMHEFIYPLMQGYDSVAMDVDLEVGASDQLFNMLVGRDLQKIYNNKDKNVMAMKLLMGTDGRKMSKTYENAIYLADSARDKFGKVMSVRDDLINDYFELCTDLPKEKIEEIKKLPNPRDQKVILAKEIVKIYHGQEEAEKAAQEFKKIFRDKELPPEMEVFETGKTNYAILDLLCDSGLASSKNEAKRLIEGNSVSVIASQQAKQSYKIHDWKEVVEIKSGMIIKVGKRNFIKIKFK